jgi:CubicO group peptidase (beta-lactamase class C family)
MLGGMSYRAMTSTMAVTLAVAGLVASQPPVQQAATADIERFIDRAFAVGATPGLGVAVILDGRVVLNRGYGLADATAKRAADPRTYWYTASTSKSFMGFALALLAAEGAIDLNAPIGKTLPSARWHPDARVADLTPLSFLSHSHGLASGAVVISSAFTGAFPESRLPDLLESSAPLPTRDLAYSNLGYNVAGMIVDRVHPAGWKHFLDARVFEPAGMRETHSRLTGLDPRRLAMPHALTPEGRFQTTALMKRDVTLHAAGGHFATTGDLARWLLVHMNDGTLDGRRVFPESVVQRTHELLARHPDGSQARRFAFFDREGWGMGWDVGSYEGDRMVSRFGSYASYRSHASYLPGRRAGVVAMTNGPAGSALTDIIAAYVYDSVAGRADAETRGAGRLDQLATRVKEAPAAVAADRDRRAARQKPLPNALDLYAGAYAHPLYGTMAWTVRDGRLHVTWGVVEETAEVFAAEQHQMRITLTGGGSVVEFVFEGNGPATALRWNGIEFARTR